MVIFYTPAVKLVIILSMSRDSLCCFYQENPLLQAIMTWKLAKLIIFSLPVPPYLHREVAYKSLYQIWRVADPPRAKNGKYLHQALKMAAILSMTSLLRKPFDIGNYDICLLILTLQYWFPCDFDSKLPQQKNHNLQVWMYMNIQSIRRTISWDTIYFYI